MISTVKRERAGLCFTSLPGIPHLPGREQDRIIVLDIARRSQLEALKPSLMEENRLPRSRMFNRPGCALRASISAASSIDGNNSARLATIDEMVCASSGVSRPAPTLSSRSA